MTEPSSAPTASDVPPGFLEALERAVQSVVEKYAPMLVPRTGIGYDVHRFVEGRPLMLGGVEVPSDMGLDGHSDADAAIHAVIDALLGAAALGDIGHFFPDTDPAYKDIDSMELLRRCRDRLHADGWRIVSTDVTIIAEKPKLAPHVPLMRERLAEAMGITAAQVSVKATTHEKLGTLGRREGLAALACATLLPPNPPNPEKG